MALSLRNIVHNRYGSFIPGGFSVRANVLSRAKYDVGEQAYLTADGKVSLRLLLLALEQPVPTFHLPDTIWHADDNAYYFLRQEENGTLWWTGLSSDPDPAVDTPSPDPPNALQYGLSFTTVFQGRMGGSLIEGVWVDVPRGERLNSGWLSLKFTTTADGLPMQLQKIASSGDGFGASVWGIARGYSYFDSNDIDSAFSAVYKNQNAPFDHTLLDNLKPYKDSAVVFCTVNPDLDLPQDYTGPPWHVNYPPPLVDVTYKDFICLDGNNSPPDGDLIIEIDLDRAQLERRTNFWTEGWYRNSDPIKQKLDEQQYNMHLEVIMFARTAECGDDPNTFNWPPSLPGWYEINGNSVLLNGRPINGQVEIGDKIEVDVNGNPVKNEWFVTTVGGKTLAKDTYLRVTGVIVLDCGHADGLDVRPCYEDISSYPNQEIHPVYAIDIIDATSSDDLSGTWSDDDGRTFYLRQLADNTLWGLGMSPLRDYSYARVFQGAIQDDQLITVHWVDVSGLGFGQSTGSMTLRTAGPGQTCLFDGSICRFVASSDSPVEQRWTKLYDIPAPV